MIDVFMIDDHPPVIQGIEFMLNSSGEEIRMCGSALTIRDAYTKLPSHRPDIILLDLFIGESDPIGNFDLIRAICPDIPVIIYSAENSVLWKVRMFREGAKAYLCKCIDEKVILETIKRVSHGGIYIPEELRGMVGPDAKTSWVPEFTLEEIEIAQDLASGMTLREIAIKRCKSESTIEKTSHVMRQKTGARTLPQMVKILLSQRYIPLSSSL